MSPNQRCSSETEAVLFSLSAQAVMQNRGLNDYTFSLCVRSVQFFFLWKVATVSNSCIDLVLFSQWQWIVTLRTVYTYTAFPVIAVSLHLGYLQRNIFRRKLL